MAIVELSEPEEEARGGIVELGQSGAPDPIAESRRLPPVPEEERGARQVTELGVAELLQDRPELAEPERGRDVLRATGRAALETAAGIAAPELGGPALALRLGRLGSALVKGGLAAGGEAAGSLASETFDPSEDPARQAQIAAATGIGGEALGRGVGTVANRIRRGGTDLEPGAREAIETITERGGVLTPGLATRSRVLDILENMTQSSLFGGGRLARTRQQAIELAQEPVDEFVESFSRIANRETVEDLARDAIEEGADAFKVEAERLYGLVDELTPRGPVRTAGRDATARVGDATFGFDTRSFEDQALSIVDIPRVRKLAETIVKEQAEALGDPPTLRVARQILEKPGKITFREAARLRSALLRVGRGDDSIVVGDVAAAGKRLGAEIDKAITAAGRGLDDPELLEAFRAANQFWKEGVTEFNSALVKKLTKKDPQSIFSVAVKNRSPREVRRVRRIIERDPVSGRVTPEGREVWEEIQGQWLRDTRSLPDVTNDAGQVSAKAFERKIAQAGDEMLNNLFDPAQTRALKQNLRTLRIAQSKAGSEGTGRIFIQLQQAGSVLALAGYAIGRESPIAGGAATAIIAGPAIMGRILTSPRFARWATIGTGAPPFSERRLRAAGMMVAEALRLGAEIGNVGTADPDTAAARAEALSRQALSVQ